jgi:hypothetical protein
VTSEFTSQVFFDDAVTKILYQTSPYDARGTQDTTTASDGIYNTTTASGSVAGDNLLLNLIPSGVGYQAVYNVYLK